jgi:hypothetical protein
VSEREERSPKPEEVKEVKEETLMEKVLKSQRDAVAAIGISIAILITYLLLSCRSLEISDYIYNIYNAFILPFYL